MQSAHYLLKSRANSLTFQKYWEVGLKGRMIPASSIPLVERHRPARKGLRRWSGKGLHSARLVERHRPARKGLR